MCKKKRERGRAYNERAGKKKCSETKEDERETCGGREAQTYSEKVELGCNDGWLGRLPRLAGGSEEGTVG